MKKVIDHLKKWTGCFPDKERNIFSGKQRVNYSVILTLVLLMPSLCYCENRKVDKGIQKAYELRIDGKADQAKDLLDNILKDDPKNAMAYYELSRTLSYMKMGSEEATLAIKNALMYDPNNVIYIYASALDQFLQAYIKMKQGGDDVKTIIDGVCKEFVKVIELKSDYYEALMYLVEIYGFLPENMGGDKEKAELYVQELEKLNPFYGAKARLVLMSDSANAVEFWKNHLSKYGENINALKELGVAYLFVDDEANAKKCFEKLIQMDPAQNIRLLDLSRYHMMKVMQNKELASDELPKSKEYIEQYLLTMPEPIAPLKAYAIGMLVKIEMFTGNKLGAEKLMEEAKTLDPYFSRAFAIPSPALFEPPNMLDRHFMSFFNPY